MCRGADCAWGVDAALSGVDWGGEGFLGGGVDEGAAGVGLQITVGQPR